MKIKVTYTKFNTSVPRLVARVYKISPFGLPDGILESIFTAKAQLIGASGAGTPAVIGAPTADGQTLISDSSQTTGFKFGAPSVSVASDHNYLINGGFAFAQRQVPGTDTTIADEKYSADRWRITRASADLQYSRQDGTSESGLTSQYFGRFKKITNAGKIFMYQPLEYVDSIGLRGQDVIFQVQLKASSAKTVKIAILELQAAGTADSLPAAAVSSWNLDGTDPTLGTNLAVVGSVESCSVTTGWQIFSVTAAIPSDSKNVIVAVWSDAQFSAADYLCLAEAGLYKGSSQFSWNPRSRAQEALLCWRYYKKTYDMDTAPGTSTSNGASSGIAVNTSQIWGKTIFGVLMRSSSPTIQIYSRTGTANKVTLQSSGADVGSAAVAGGPCDNSVAAVVDATAPYTVGNVYSYHFTASAEL